MNKGPTTRRRRRGTSRNNGSELTHHSPPAVPSLLLKSWVLPAAADAKLDGSGVGMMLKMSVYRFDDIITSAAIGRGQVNVENSSRNRQWTRRVQRGRRREARTRFCGGEEREMRDAKRDGEAAGEGVEERRSEVLKLMMMLGRGVGVLC